MRADIHDGQGAKHSLQRAEYRCARSSSPDRHIRLAPHGRSIQSIWPGGEARRPRAGRRSSAIMPTASRRSLVLWLVNHRAWSTTDFMVWRYSASDRRMDRKSDHASVWLGPDSLLSDPRSRWSLWRGFHPKTSIDGYSRSTDVATLPMAKRIC
jgi:hypothetical protein